MKITNQQLRQIIKEELEATITEMDSNDIDNLRPELRDEFRELPDAGGSIAGSPGASARDELIEIAGSMDSPEDLQRLAQTVQSEAAKRALEAILGL
jgi:hypothetical protein